MHSAFALILAVAFLATPSRDLTEAERLAEFLALRTGLKVAGRHGGRRTRARPRGARRAGCCIYATEIEAEKRDEIRVAAMARENRARGSVTLALGVALRQLVTDEGRHEPR
jgi:hypothetical protein